MRLIWLFLLNVLILAFLSVLFFIIVPSGGEPIGAFIFIVWQSIGLFLGDRIILLKNKARKISDEDNLYQVIKNISYRENLPFVDVYSSREIKEAVYVVESLYSRPSLLVGRGVTSRLSSDELESYLHLALLKIKHKDALYNTSFVSTVSLLLLPLFLFKRGALSRALNFFFLTLFRPIFHIHGYISRKNDYVFYRKEAVGSYRYNLLKSSFRKLRYSTDISTAEVFEFLMKNLAITKRAKNYLIDTILSEPPRV